MCGGTFRRRHVAYCGACVVYDMAHVDICAACIALCAGIFYVAGGKRQDKKRITDFRALSVHTEDGMPLCGKKYKKDKKVIYFFVLFSFLCEFCEYMIKKYE